MATLAVQRETRTIPIVFASAGDPVAIGLVPRLDRPGGNITGFAPSPPSGASRGAAWAAHDAIDIGGGATIVVYQVGSVREQAAVSGIVRMRIDRRYVVSGRRRYDRRAMEAREIIRQDDKAASRLAPKGDDGRFDFYVVVNGRNDWLDLLSETLINGPMV